MMDKLLFHSSGFFFPSKNILTKHSRYKVTITTGSRRGSGTDAAIHINLIGETNESGVHPLDGSFERGEVDEFGIECVELGTIKQIRIGHDNSGFGPGWFLDKVTVRNESDGRGLSNTLNFFTFSHQTLEYYFLVGRWLAKDEGDGKIALDLNPSNEDGQASRPVITYRVTVETGDRRGILFRKKKKKNFNSIRLGAGTDANVFVELYGENGKTGEKILDGGKKAFERSSKDVFGIESEDLGIIRKIRVGHDGKGFAAGWSLEKVLVRNETSGDGEMTHSFCLLFFHWFLEYYFLCGRWLAKDEDDGSLVREIVASTENRPASVPLVTYKLTVITADRRGAGTSSDVFATLYGQEGDSGEQALSGKKGTVVSLFTSFLISFSSLPSWTSRRIWYRDNRPWRDNKIAYWTQRQRIWKCLDA